MINGTDGNKKNYENRRYLSAIETAEYLDIYVKCFTLASKEFAETATGANRSFDVAA